MYENLEYEQALAELKRTRRYVRDLDEQALVAFYEGIVLADLNQKEQAKAAFRSGLKLKPDARLPIKVSPKVEQDFEAVRADVRREVALPRTQDTARITYQKRWPAWMPWAVMGSGLAVAAGGTLLHNQAINNYRDYDIEIQKCGGCVPPLRIATTRTQGDILQNTAYGTYALGGAAVVGGAVLFFLNQLQPDRTNPVSGAEAVNITPLVGGTNGFMATFRF